MRYLHYVLFAITLWLPGVTISGEWQQLRDENGIKLFTAEVEDSVINKVKAVTVIDASLEQLEAALNDVSNYPSWVPYLKEARILERYSDDELLVYNYFDAPWPAQDRDYLYRVQINRRPSQANYAMQTAVSELMPVQKKAVRALLIESHYELTAINEKQTRMELVFHTDPRGQLPLWIINIVHKRVPFEGLKRLRHQMNAQE